MAGDKKLFSKCLLVRFRLELFVLDNKALVAASADLSFGVVSGNIEYETTSVYLDKFSLAPYGHSKWCRCVVCYVSECTHSTAALVELISNAHPGGLFH